MQPDRGPANPCISIYRNAISLKRSDCSIYRNIYGTYFAARFTIKQYNYVYFVNKIYETAFTKSITFNIFLFCPGAKPSFDCICRIEQLPGRPAREQVYIQPGKGSSCGWTVV